jgi:hypothetical protein
MQLLTLQRISRDSGSSLTQDLFATVSGNSTQISLQDLQKLIIEDSNEEGRVSPSEMMHQMVREFSETKNNVINAEEFQELLSLALS